MDSWFHEEDISILESFEASFCGTSSEDFPGLSIYNGGLANYPSNSGCSDPMQFTASQIPNHSFESAVSGRSGYIDFRGANSSNISVQTKRKHSFLKEFNQQQPKMEFFPSEHSQPSSTSLSSLKSLSMGSQEFTSLLNTTANACFPPNSSTNKVSAQTTGAVACMQKTTGQSYTQSRNAESDDAAIMRAIVAVISSSNSSSSNASSPSVLSQSPFEAQMNRAQASCPSPAFKPYSSALSPKFNLDCKFSGQKMIKKSISMLKSINVVKPEEQAEEMRPSSNHLHHMISERRRREKLNDSFHTLRMLLPPASKKDKASVLNNARNYLNTLKTQISELEEKNRRLETHLSADETPESNGSTGNIKVKIIKSSEPTAEVQQVNLRVTIRVECDIVELVLHLLECLKALRVINIASVDAYTYSPQMPLYARANLQLQIKACDWNETSLHEATTKAIHGAVAFPQLRNIFFGNA